MNKKIENLIEELRKEAQESNTTLLVALGVNDGGIHLGGGKYGELARLHFCNEIKLCEELELTGEELRSLALSQALEEMERSSSDVECSTCGADRKEASHKYCVICGTKFQEG